MIGDICRFGGPCTFEGTTGSVGIACSGAEFEVWTLLHDCNGRKNIHTTPVQSS